MVDLGSDAHGLFEGACANRQDHELLHGKLVARVRATVDHIEGLAEVEGETDESCDFTMNWGCLNDEEGIPGN